MGIHVANLFGGGSLFRFRDNMVSLFYGDPLLVRSTGKPKRTLFVCLWGGSPYITKTSRPRKNKVYVGCSSHLSLAPRGERAQLSPPPLPDEALSDTRSSFLQRLGGGGFGLTRGDFSTMWLNCQILLVVSQPMGIPCQRPSDQSIPQVESQNEINPERTLLLLCK